MVPEGLYDSFQITTKNKTNVTVQHNNASIHHQPVSASASTATTWTVPTTRSFPVPGPASFPITWPWSRSSRRSFFVLLVFFLPLLFSFLASFLPLFLSLLLSFFSSLLPLLPLLLHFLFAFLTLFGSLTFPLLEWSISLFLKWKIWNNTGSRRNPFTQKYLLANV